MISSACKWHHLTRLSVSATNLGQLQQIRTTYILKRRFSPMLKKVDDPRPKPFRVRHFIYDLVEHTLEKRPPDVSVILTSYVEGIGDRGTVVSLRPGIARFHFLLPGLAVYASPENLKMLKEDILLSKEREPAFSSPFTPITMKAMRKTIFEVLMNSEESWIVTPWHIRVALRIAGFVVPEVAIELPSQPITGPNMDYQNKDFAVFITINGKEKFPVRCRLHHTEMPLDDDWQLVKSEAILPDQEEILRTIPYPTVEKKK